MGEIHEWGVGTIRSIAQPPAEDFMRNVLQLRADDSEAEVLKWLRVSYPPHFLLAPDKGLSRENSITASNVRRFTEDRIPIVVTVRGETRRERMDFTSWLVGEDYIPAFPRFMKVKDTVIPRTRHQTLVELRGLIEGMDRWIYFLPDLRENETTVREIAKAIPVQWEATVE